MRIDKLRIGSSDPSPSHRFKNLKDVTIDFDQDEWVTVVIGWNGTGKSNVLEALAIIFRELIGSGKRRQPSIDFAFGLSYRIGHGKAQKRIVIEHDPDKKESFDFSVEQPKAANPDARAAHKVRLAAFLRDESNLPRYVFSYYSGESSRMREVFSPYTQWYDEQLRKGKDPGLKRLFYALPVHSQFVLLAFMIGRTDKDVSELLRDHLGLNPDEGLESVLFVLRRPPWKPHPDGDARFWGARGIVSNFLSRLWDVALAPIDVERWVPTSLWNKETLDFKYLYIKDIDALRQLVGKQAPAHFFRDLESTYVSQLVEEVRIKVRLKKNDAAVTFRELSEGEQQLLTVLGLLRFTSEEESLFLLDEPDTHLNPKWSVDYLTFLRGFVGSAKAKSESSHVIMTTHNPLAIAELERGQVQILQSKQGEVGRRIVSCHPEMAPRGMGYAAIVTSEMFGIASTLDRPTQVDLEKQRLLSSKEKLSKREQSELDSVNGRLDALGFRFVHPDDEYTRYLRHRREALQEIYRIRDMNALAEHATDMSLKEREELSKRIIGVLMQSKEGAGDALRRR